MTFFIMATTFSVMGDKQVVVPAGICVGRDCFDCLIVLSVLPIYVLAPLGISYRLLPSEVDAIAPSMLSHLQGELLFTV